MAQYQLSGMVRSASDSLGIIYCGLTIEGVKSVSSDSSGYFEFKNLPGGNYIIHVNGFGYKTLERSIKIEDKDLSLDFWLESDPLLLDEVVIQQEAKKYMRGVEDMGIYEGKKSTVITPDNMVVNTATNNARQVFSQVAGLNIWENDGAGLQLSIGGRGLDPNRTSNFNVRQNGYDISADALGYPESYYTPPIEAVERIQVVRGAASLQYGTQFGGLLNFVLRRPVPDKKIQLVARQSVGSFGFYNSFTSLSGTNGKLSYYTFFQYKRGDGWRPNSKFDNYNYYGHIGYNFSKRTSIKAEITLMDYLAQQPGGLSDAMFAANPRQSNRERNWFKVKWNLAALHFNHKFNESNEFNLRVFGLSAFRYSLGFRPYRVATVDDNSERDLIKGEFLNWGAEARYMKKYSILKKASVLLIGGRYYHGFNKATQGQGSDGKGADFNYTSENIMTYDYQFPNRNVSFFIENIFYLTDRFSLTPGIRYEYIHTTADGFYGNIIRDLAGNILKKEFITEYRTNRRQFLLGGLGASYNLNNRVNMYANISQNYRSITFSDMRISNPSSVIDPNMNDEKGYSMDIGIRNKELRNFNFDISLFCLNYNNRIGEVLTYDNNNRVLRSRGNIGQAIMLGVESFGEVKFMNLIKPNIKNWGGSIFVNVALINSNYRRSQLPGVQGNEVEFVPKVNLKSGIRMEYKKFKAAFQYTYLSSQFSDATNSKEGGVAAVVGIIPSYSIIDLSTSYEFKWFKLELTFNNLGNQMYFTRRATGYPGPGILPSDGRSIYLTFQVKI